MVINNRPPGLRITCGGTWLWEAFVDGKIPRVGDVLHFNGCDGRVMVLADPWIEHGHWRMAVIGLDEVVAWTTCSLDPSTHWHYAKEKE